MDTYRLLSKLVMSTLGVNAYGSRRLKLRPLHPLVGLEATTATRIAITAPQTALKGKFLRENKCGMCRWFSCNRTKKNTQTALVMYEITCKV